MKKRTNEEFINECKLIHGNDFSYDKTKFVNVNTKIIVTNKYGEDISVWPLDFLKKNKNKNTRYTTQSFIRRSKEIFGQGTYTYEKAICNKSTDYVTITCPKHGDFSKQAYAHINLKQGCPKCSLPISSTEEFILKAREIHGWKYDYSKVNYIDNSTKVTIICPKHGEFNVLPLEHIHGSNCKKCVNESRIKPLEKFINDGKLKERGISIVGQYRGMFKKVNFKCDKCGKEWTALPNKIQIGEGCPYCKKGVSSTEDFIKHAKEIHGDKYDYSKVNYINYITPVEIICHEKDKNGNEHGIFKITPTKFFNTITPCKKCSRKSKMEHDIMIKLDEHGIRYINNQTFKKINMKSYDFYLPDFNILIECQGSQHFEPNEFFGGEEQFKKQTNSDIIKQKYAKDNGFKLIYFINENTHTNFLGYKLINNIDDLISEIYNCSK